MEIPVSLTTGNALVVFLFFVVGILLIWHRSRLGRLQRRLIDNQERLQLALHSSKVGIWSWESQQDIISADNTCSTLFGLPDGEFPRHLEEFTALVHADDRVTIQEKITDAVKRGAEYNASFRIVLPDRTIRFLAARGKACKDKHDRSVRLIGACWDITTNMRVENELTAANAQLNQSVLDLEKRNRENTLLAEMTDLLQVCSTIEEAYEIVAKSCGNLFPQFAGALFILSTSRDRLARVADWNNPTNLNDEFVPDDCWALRLGRPHITGPEKLEPTCMHAKNDTRRTHACFPMIAQGNGLGIVYFQSRDAYSASTSLPEVLGMPEQELALSVTRQIGPSLAALSLRTELRLQTIRDPLTGLFNRRYMEESLERELQRMIRSHRPASLAMIDLDHFKAFNDTFGHEAGNVLLRAFGQLLKQHCRRGDVACRYGGEEFSVLFCEALLEDVAKRCDHIRSEVKRLTVRYELRQVGPITVSIGVSCYPANGETVADLIAAADKALYQAKAAGRDRVMVAEPEFISAAEQKQA